jgi:hypothetical protein
MARTPGFQRDFVEFLNEKIDTLERQEEAGMVIDHAKLDSLRRISAALPPKPKTRENVLADFNQGGEPWGNA